MNRIMDQQAVLDKAQALLKQGWEAARHSDWSEAEAKFADALQMGGRLDPTESDIPVVAMLAMAQISYERGKKEEAIQRATSAFALSAETENFSGWQFPLYELMANLFDEMGVPHRAIPFRNVMVRLWRELEGSDSQKTAAACAHLGASFERLGFYDHAARAYAEAARGGQQYRQAWASSLHRAGRLAESEGVYRQLLEECRARHGAGHADTAEVLAGLASLHSSSGRHEDANHCFYEAFRIQLALGSDKTPAIASLKTNWAAALTRQGRLDEARRTAEEAVAIWQSQNARELAAAYDALGRIHELEGEHHQAEHYCREALRLMDQHHVTDVSNRQSRLEWHAGLLGKLGRAEDAERACANAARIAEARRNVPDPETLLGWGSHPELD